MRADFWNAPPDEKHRQQILDTLEANFAALRVTVIGKSVLGRPIHALSLGHREGGVLYVGGVHGLEWLTSLVLLRFMTDLLDRHATGTELAGVDVRRAMQDRGLTIVPCLNPDGIELALSGIEAAGDRRADVLAISEGDLSSWQANIRGVDLNHNFDAGFETVRAMEEAASITGPSPRQYGGTAAESEPETQAITAFIEEIDPRSLYAFHSQGEEIFYRYGNRTPDRARLMGEILATTSGYTLCDPEGMASHGGLKDWFIERYGRPGFTFEIGKGKNPLPVSDLIPIYERLRETLVLGIIL